MHNHPHICINTYDQAWMKNTWNQICKNDTCNQAYKNVIKHTAMIHVSDINWHVTIYTLTVMHSTITPQISHDNITTTMNNIMQMQQAHGMQGWDPHMQLTCMHYQHIAHLVRVVNHSLIPLCNTLLPHLPKQPASQGKHVMRDNYDIIRSLLSC